MGQDMTKKTGMGFSEALTIRPSPPPITTGSAQPVANVLDNPDYRYPTDAIKIHGHTTITAKAVVDDFSAATLAMVAQKMANGVDTQPVSSPVDLLPDNMKTAGIHVMDNGGIGAYLPPSNNGFGFGGR